MTIKIQKPTIGRVVEYTAADTGVIHAAVVCGGLHRARGLIDLRDQNDLAMHEGVHHNSDGAPGTWRYPPFVKEEIEVDG